jgi:mRNA interferase HigB
MVLVGREKIVEFMRMHADSRKWFEAWLADVEEARWRTPIDVKMAYPKASILARNRVIFDVKGNDYRMEVVIAYKTGHLAIVRIGTHRDYDSWTR